MKTHELKCWPEFFHPLTTGAKRFEYRRDDRGFEVGDVLYLREFVPGTVPIIDGKLTTIEPRYTGATARRLVTYILRAPKAGVPDGFVVMSLEQMPS